MAISDPRKIRPVGQAPEPTSFDAEEDPLVELARIVSEDGGFSGRRAERAKPRQEPQRSHSGLSADLEAELLEELESSFAEQKAAAATPRPAPTPAPRPVVAPPPPAASVQPHPASRMAPPQRPVTPLRTEPAPAREADLSETDADELLRSIEEQLSEFERRAQASRIAAEEEDIEAALDAPAAIPDPADEWRPRHAAQSRYPAEDEPVPLPVARRQDPPAAAGVTDYRFRGPARDRNGEARHYDETAEEPVVLRPLSEVSFGEALKARNAVAPLRPTNGAASASDDRDPAESFVKRDRRASAEEFRREARGTVSDIEDVQFSDPVVEAGLVDVEAEISRQLEPRYADPTFAGRRQAEVEEADEPRVAAVAAAREQIGRPPVRNSARRQSQQQRRGGLRKGLLMAASVIVVAAVGAAAAMYMRAGEQAPSGPPPVIAAPEGAVKVEPQQDQAAAEGESIGEAVYNRVAGTANDTEEQVVDSSEEPREIARIVLPEQTASDDPVVRQVGEGAAPTAAEPAEDEIGPRRVQTFVVRPDGTIVTSEDAGARPDPAAAQQQQLAAQTEQIEPVPVATVAIGDSTARATPAEEAAAAPASATETQDPAGGPEQAVAALAPADPVAAPADMTAAPPEAPATTGAAPPDAGASVGEGYVVQVSSQRSREQAAAAYTDMQNRYASVLGGLNASVQEADLGEKGIYYRVRVGPWATREEAIGVCESLKGAGGSCFVTQ